MIPHDTQTIMVSSCRDIIKVIIYRIPTKTDVQVFMSL